jgi:hypothetical protein
MFHGQPPDARSDKDLHRVMARYSAYPESEQYLDAKLELERRQWFRDFWTTGIVAWIALGISIVAIIVSVLVLICKQ